MARDFRHGHQSKQGFQRKSQSATSQKKSAKPSAPMFWAAGFLVSAILLVGFFVTQHFVTNGAKSGETSEKSIFKVAQDLQEKTLKSVEAVSEKIQPKPVKVEAIPIESLQTPEVSDKPEFSFYDGLGQVEVEVDAEPLSVTLKQSYYIQAGTFSSKEMALKEKDRLGKLGQDLRLSVSHTKTHTYHRLMMGPFTDRLVMNKKRNELRRLGVDTLLVKAPKSK